MTHLIYRNRLLAGACVLTVSGCLNAAAAEFGPSNPFYAPSTLPFAAPPFDRIKDGDYQPAIEAGMAQQLAEINAIANNPAAPTFENTFAALERSGRLLARASAAFNGVSEANTNPVLQKAKTALAPQLAAHQDAIRLNKKLFERVAAIYRRRTSLKLDPESLRLLEFEYKKFVHSGANLSPADKEKLKKLNEEDASLSAKFTNQLLAAAKDAALVVSSQDDLAGLSQAELAAALGVSRQTVISIENGRYLPSLPLAFRIARFFDLTVDKMFDPDDEGTAT